MNRLLSRITSTPVTVIDNGDVPLRPSWSTYPECPHCGRFGARVSGRSYTVVHRNHCVIAEGLRAQHELDAARFLDDSSLSEFARPYGAFERLDAEIRWEFLPPGATTVVRREAVLAG